MPSSGNVVKFKHGTQAEYNRSSKDSDSLYFTDEGRMFLGDKEYTRPVLTGTSTPSTACTPRSIYIRDVAKSGTEGQSGYTPAHKEIWYNESGSANEWVQVVSEPLGTVRYDIIQSLTNDQKIRARANVGAASQSDLTAHAGNKENPHEVTKSQIGLDNVTNDAQVKRSEMGVAKGVATLDDNGHVPASQLPSYVDDVIEGYLIDGKFYKDSGKSEEIPASDGKIYVNINNGENKTYRWSGSAYVEISQGVALGETSGTAYRGDRGKTAYDHSQKTSGNPHNVTKSDLGLGSVDNTSDLNKPVSIAQQSAIDEVILLDEDLIVTNPIGALDSGVTFAKGTSVQEILTQILAKELDPAKIDPTITKFILSPSSVEVGTLVDPSWTAEATRGSYSYKSTVSKDQIRPEEGTRVLISWEIFRVDPSDTSKEILVGSKTGPTSVTNPYKDTSSEDAFYITSNTVYTANLNYSDGNYALTNMNKLPATDVRITAGSTTKEATLTVYRKMFAGGTTSSDVTSDVIRALSSSAASAKKTNWEFTAKVGDTKIILAFPSTLTSASPTFEYFTMSWENFPGFTKRSTTVNVADARGGSTNAIAYTVYEYTPASAFEADTKFRVTIK